MFLGFGLGGFWVRINMGFTFKKMGNKTEECYRSKLEDHLNMASP